MKRLLFVTIFFIAVTGAISSVAKSFEAHQVVPDVLSKPPNNLVTVKYPSGVEVNEGNVLTPTQVKDEPTLSWDTVSDKLYTIVMIDPDAPSRKKPLYREVRHWLVGNVPGNDIAAGEVLAAYIGSGPPETTGQHRYIFLVYQQPGKLNFDEPRISNTSADERGMFSTNKFAQKYNLGDPVAGNFYQAEYDDYVPILRKSLGL